MATTAQTKGRKGDVRVLPRKLGSLISHRPLLFDENKAQYDKLYENVIAAVQPRDALEELWVKDVVDLAWESDRWRRLKSALLNTARQLGLKRMLGTLFTTPGVIFGEPSIQFAWQDLRGERAISELTDGWMKGTPAAVAEVNKLLAERGLDLNAILAEALSAKLGDIERLERMIASADARRNRALAEIERRRESLSRRLRIATDVTDITVEPPRSTS